MNYQYDSVDNTIKSAETVFERKYVKSKNKRIKKYRRPRPLSKKLKNIKNTRVNKSNS